MTYLLGAVGTRAGLHGVIGWNGGALAHAETRALDGLVLVHHGLVVTARAGDLHLVLLLPRPRRHGEAGCGLLGAFLRRPQQRGDVVTVGGCRGTSVIISTCHQTNQGLSKNG